MKRKRQKKYEFQAEIKKEGKTGEKRGRIMKNVRNKIG
jgi:hypothetical protein